MAGYNPRSDLYLPGQLQCNQQLFSDIFQPNYWSDPKDKNDSSKTPTPGFKPSFQAELYTSSHLSGVLSYRILYPGFSVKQNKKIIVFFSLLFDWVWMRGKKGIKLLKRDGFRFKINARTFSKNKVEKLAKLNNLNYIQDFKVVNSVNSHKNY